MSVRKPGKLIPARPEAVADGDYMPRLPWRILVPGALILTMVVVGHQAKEQQKLERLRSDILQVHGTELADATTQYLAFRDRLDAWILGAAAKAPEPFVDKRLKLSGLRAGSGIYLRLPAQFATKKENISEGALHMGADAITRCLGLSPASGRGLYEKGAFLLPEWVEDVRELDDVMTMRVKDEVLARHIKGDLTGVLGLLRSDWFLLILEQGPSRGRDPVDVFLWDIQSGEQLLAARVRSRGLLLPARILSKGVHSAPELANSRLHHGAAVDCSIAANIRELVGFPAPMVHSITDDSFRPPAAAETPDAGIAPAAHRDAPTSVDAGMQGSGTTP